VNAPFAATVRVTAHFPDAFVTIVLPFSEHFPTTDHVCTPDEFDDAISVNAKVFWGARFATFQEMTVVVAA
jgi:hypothetical protein